MPAATKPKKPAKAKAVAQEAPVTEPTTIVSYMLIRLPPTTTRN